jgi:hypothetical protein
MAKKDKPVDWDGIERDYCSGEMGLREIARWYGVSHTAINKRAKKDGWKRKSAPKHVEQEPVARSPLLPVADTSDVPDRARVLASRMVDELDAVTTHHGELEDMICSEESDPRRRRALLKALSLGERAMTLKNISQTLKTLNEAGEVGGKKAQRQANAEKSASGGRFAAPSAPKLVVSNK